MSSSAPEVTSNPALASAAPRPWRTPLAGLWTLAGLLVAVAVMFAWDYPYAATPDQLTDLGKLAQYDDPHFARFVAGVVALALAGALGPPLARRAGAAARRPVLAGALGAGIAFALMYPVSAIDVFIYAARSRLFTHWGFDPLVARPADHVTNDPFLAFASAEWGDNISPYGPAWNLIAAPATWLAGDRIDLAIWGFKAIALLAYLACGVIVWKTVAIWRPGDGLGAATLFWWSPVVLWEGVGNAHNDLVMLVPILLALYLWARGAHDTVVPLLVAAALIKYAAAILIPAVALVLLAQRTDWRARRRLIIEWAVGSAVVGVCLLSPFYDPAAILHSLRDQAGILMTSPGSVLWTWLRDTGHSEAWRQRIITGGQAIAAAVAIALALRAMRRPDRLVRCLHETLVVFVLVGIPALRPWYAIWIVAIAALLPLGWPSARAIAWSSSAVAYYAITIWVWNWTGVPFATLQQWAVAMLVGPAVFFALAEAALAIRERRNPAAGAPAAGSTPVVSG